MSKGAQFWSKGTHFFGQNVPNPLKRTQTFDQNVSIILFLSVFGGFRPLKKNPVKIFTIEKRKGPRQKFSGITHPLSYKA